MTKRELIDALEACELADDAEVVKVVYDSKDERVEYETIHDVGILAPPVERYLFSQSVIII